MQENSIPINGFFSSLMIFLVSNIFGYIKYSFVTITILFILGPWIVIGVEAIRLVYPQFLNSVYFLTYFLEIKNGVLTHIEFTQKEILSVYSSVSLASFIVSRFIPAGFFAIFGFKERLMLFSGINALGWTYMLMVFVRMDPGTNFFKIFDHGFHSWGFFYLIFVVVGVVLTLYALGIGSLFKKLEKSLHFSA